MRKKQLPLDFVYGGNPHSVSLCEQMRDNGKCWDNNPSCPGHIDGKCRFSGDNLVDEDFAHLFVSPREGMLKKIIQTHAG